MGRFFLKFKIMHKIIVRQEINILFTSYEFYLKINHKNLYLCHIYQKIELRFRGFHFPCRHIPTHKQQQEKSREKFVKRMKKKKRNIHAPLPSLHIFFLIIVSVVS